MPLTNEAKISQILKSNTYLYFQDQNQTIIDSLLTELVYLTIPKGTIIYNTNDISNYFYIINKGKIKLIKEEKHNDKNPEENKEYKKITKIINEWESFGEISFFL